MRIVSRCCCFSLSEGPFSGLRDLGCVVALQSRSDEGESTAEHQQRDRLEHRFNHEDALSREFDGEGAVGEPENGDGREGSDDCAPDALRHASRSATPSPT